MHLLLNVISINSAGLVIATNTDILEDTFENILRVIVSSDWIECYMRLRDSLLKSTSAFHTPRKNPSIILRIFTHVFATFGSNT